MRFEWNENKNASNLLKHRVTFETATLAFHDPRALTQRDELSENEERWITLGNIGSGIVLHVVHTLCEQNKEEVIRIISAAPRHPAREEKL